MTDHFTEHLVKKVPTSQERTKTILLVLAAVVLVAGTAFVAVATGLLVILMITVIVMYGAYYILSGQGIEYEYTFTNGELDVDKIMGLNMGADDYVTKPFQPLELLARVNSHLRRYSRYLNMVNQNAGTDNGNIHIIGGIELNEDTKELKVDGEPVKVTPIEFKILSLLMRNPGRVFSADEIYERVWQERHWQQEHRY